MLLDGAAEIAQHVLVVMHALARPDSHVRVARPRQADGLHDDVVAASAVAHSHVERRGGRSLLLVAIDVKALRMIAPEEQTA